MQTDGRRQTDTTKLIVAFRHFANALASQTTQHISQVVPVSKPDAEATHHLWESTVQGRFLESSGAYVNYRN